MIVPLQKITLIGPLSAHEATLVKLQQLGCLHLLPLNAAPEMKASTTSESVRQALRYLNETPNPRLPVRDERLFDLDQMVETILANRQNRRDTLDRREFLRRRLNDLKPWGEFQLPPLEALAGQRLWFYRLPVGQRKALQSLDLPWQIVHQVGRWLFVVVISPQEPPNGMLPVPRTHTGSAAVAELNAELDHLDSYLEQLDAERHALTRWRYLINRHLADVADTASLAQATAQIWRDEALFAVNGWLPNDQIANLTAFAQQQQLALHADPPQQDDNPPTLLRNPPLTAGGQDLVAFYQMPGYRDWDPSGWVFWSFALFFAMILADAGYAVVLFGVVSLYRRKLMARPSTQRLYTLLKVVLGAAFGYGVLVGSYFGVSPPPGSFLDTLKLIDMNDQDFMLKLSVVIGCLHLIAANGYRAHRQGNWPQNGVPLGWITAILGGLALYFGFPFGALLLVVGLGVVGFAAAQNAQTPIQQVLAAALALTDVTKLFGDILSYLRLFALGLASAQLAITFNNLASQVNEALPGPGLLLALLILIFGHVINLILGIVSGLVHGLRLNFIEFFNWGLTQEGYPFKPFSKQESEL